MLDGWLVDPVGLDGWLATPVVLDGWLETLERLNLLGGLYGAGTASLERRRWRLEGWCWSFLHMVRFYIMVYYIEAYVRRRNRLLDWSAAGSTYGLRVPV